MTSSYVAIIYNPNARNHADYLSHILLIDILRLGKHITSNYLKLLVPNIKNLFHLQKLIGN